MVVNGQSHQRGGQAPGGPEKRVAETHTNERIAEAEGKDQGAEMKGYNLDARYNPCDQPRELVFSYRKVLDPLGLVAVFTPQSQDVDIHIWDPTETVLPKGKVLSFPSLAALEEAMARASPDGALIVLLEEVERIAKELKG